MVALVPGISRSGATIVPAMALGLKSETALRFSFLLYIPVSLGGTILSITDIFHDPRLGSFSLFVCVHCIDYRYILFIALVHEYYGERKLGLFLDLLLCHRHRRFDIRLKNS